MQKDRIWRGRLFAYAPLFLWVGVIFLLSSGQGSMEQTSRFIGPLLEFLLPGASNETVVLYHGYIRKSAHFVEYAVLAILSFRAFSADLKSRSLRYLVTVLLVAAVASIDEINQSFEPSRTAAISDVLLDLSGGITAILTIWLFGRRQIRRAE